MSSGGRPPAALAGFCVLPDNTLKARLTPCRTYRLLRRFISGFTRGFPSRSKALSRIFPAQRFSTACFLYGYIAEKKRLGLDFIMIVIWYYVPHFKRLLKVL
jgi:hypothetical protein